MLEHVLRTISAGVSFSNPLGAWMIISNFWEFTVEALGYSGFRGSGVYFRGFGLAV